MNKYVWLVLALLSSVSVPVQAAVRVEVLAADESSLHLKILVDGATLRTGVDGLSHVVLPGAQATGEPGMPALPSFARWFALPPSGQAVLRVLSTEIEELGRARLAPVEVARLRPTGSDGPRLVESLEFADGYDLYRSSATSAVQLGEPVYQRRQRMAPLVVGPVLYDAASGRVQILSSIELRVEWPAPDGPTFLPHRDATALGAVLNPDQARQWSTLSPRQARVLDASRMPARRLAESLDPGALAADGIRMRVLESGISRVSVADLISGGGLPDDVPRSWLRLAQLRPGLPGSPEYPAPLVVGVPLHFFGNPDPAGTIGAGDEILFNAIRVEDDGDSLQSGAVLAPPPLPWGESDSGDLVAPRYVGDNFNAENIYWIFVMPPPAEGWERMEAVALPASGGNPSPSYRRVEHFEGTQGYRDEPLDQWVERYAWNRRNEVDVVRALRLWDPLPGTDLEVRWAAGGHISGSALPIDFSLRQGPVELALLSRVLGTGGVMNGWARTLVAPAFTTGPLEFRMRRLNNGSDVAVNSFLDHVELEYQAGFTASIDQLSFSTGQVGVDADVEVQGYSRDDLICFDVTDPRQPRWINLAPANIEDRSAGGPDNFVLSLRVAQAPGEERSFVAAPRVRLKRIGRASIERDPVADLSEVADDLQVIAIGPEFLRAQSERWIAWREQTYAEAGWNFSFVDVQQVYDQFSGGLQSPWALREFTEWAWLNWGTVALVLVGDANEDVLDGSGNAGPNLVPTSLHLQDFSGSRELLASDKWFGVFGYAPTGNQKYPKGLRVTSDVLIGRFPVATEGELASHIDKLIAYEQSEPEADWRRRTLWVADDAYSSNLIGAGQGCYEYQGIEEGFFTSQQSSAAVVTGALDSTLTGVTQNADDFTASCRLGSACENLPGIRACFAANHAADFLDRWSEGWLWLSYQGHANYNVLGHENLLLSGTLSLLRNDGRPFVFFGMGCHVSDFLRADEGSDGKSLGELVLGLPRAGAIATYGSSGFEFLTPNAGFMEVLADVMFARRVPDSPVLGPGQRNQWILGDVMARAELETLPLNLFLVDEMVAQYNLLGDPLLRMDGGAPRMEVTRGGQPVSEGSSLVADAGLSTAALDLSLVDETGLDRLEITDSEGRDYAGSLPGLSGPDPRLAQLSLELPVFPQAYTVEIATFDSARPALRRTVLGLQVAMPLNFSVDGEVVVPGSEVALAPEITRAMRVEFTSPVDLVEADIALDYADVDILSESKVGDGRSWTVSFDVRAREGTPPGDLNLRLRGQPTLLVSSGLAPGEGAPEVLRHVVFPNPMQESARVVVEVKGTVDRARLSVYDLAGNEVNSREFQPGAGTAITLDFDARDRRGDELANGTYFYRISVDGPYGSARSDMGRMVIMR